MSGNAERIAAELAALRDIMTAERDARYVELAADLGWIRDLLSERLGAIGTGTQATPYPDQYGATYYAMSRALEELSVAVSHAHEKDGAA